MATDPGLLTSWYQDYTAANPAKTTPAATTNDQAQTPASTGMLASAPAPAGFTPAQATATNWAPDANSTVAGQVAKITAAGSPLIDQATTAARLRIFQREASDAGVVNLTKSRVVSFVQGLEGGVLQAGRAATILGAPITDDEAA